MQIDVHITVYLCYTTKKMTHVAATVPKMRFVGSNIGVREGILLGGREKFALKVTFSV